MLQRPHVAGLLYGTAHHRTFPPWQEAPSDTLPYSPETCCVRLSSLARPRLPTATGSLKPGATQVSGNLQKWLKGQDSKAKAPQTETREGLSGRCAAGGCMSVTASHSPARARPTALSPRLLHSPQWSPLPTSCHTLPPAGN